MKWIIKNPAPEGDRKEKWGDFHFGRSLAKYLERLGQEVETHYQPEWERGSDGDVVLVLRGKHRYSVPAARHALMVLWNISHPEDVSLEEFGEYDLVGVGSESYAQWLNNKAGVSAVPLLQCTDGELFGSEEGISERDRRGFVFVGNTRETERPGVLWGKELGLPLEVWGRGWTQWSDVAPNVVSQYIENEQLGDLYRRSRVTINDHWPDMKQFGFINNRVFDALACGLPVICDFHEELASLFPEEVLFYRDREDFRECVKRTILEYPEIHHRASQGGRKVLEKFTFKRRAEELLKLARNRRS